MKSAKSCFALNSVCWKAALLSVCLVWPPAGLTSESPNSTLAEKMLVETLKNIQYLELDEAIALSAELTKNHPDYRLAQLIHADLLSMRAGNFGLINQIHQSNPRTVGRYKQEAEVRWRHAHSDENQANVTLAHSVLKVGEQPHVIVVNLAKNRLYLYQNNQGQLDLLTDYYISMGTAGGGKQREGDRKTPIGVYHITDWVPGERLADLFGVGALPLNYPNIWDQSLGRTGHGIWLHGTASNTFSRPPQSSQGCVVLNNDEMGSLVTKYNVSLATPVVILNEKVETVFFEAEKLAVLTEINAWLADQGQNFDWGKVSVYRYPNEEGLYYATFPSVETDGHLVHQYWRRGHDGGWQLVLQTTDPVMIKTSLS
ncbi:MAG: L,D-transpeptidase family protein [Thiomicrospira sp.]|uniref:L,D-transpeptidase family protein n=1 Tax=Thiomicrospira sp. TaxID=935 RepID=UPI001A00E10F|nr:L,D-transpeptidase family protein [Thiomicrospira sp.]MBE0493939.1 L,D-transpeptidase family protein [Thiomicrospira sp.]